MKALALKSAVALTASVIAALTPQASALAGTGQITRADASPDWTRGSIAGFVTTFSPGSAYRVTHAWAFVLPNSAACKPFSMYPPGGVGLVWGSSFGDHNPSFDIPDLPLNSGISPRLCLYGYLDVIDLPTGGESLLASRSFTVPPPPFTPQPPSTPQPQTAAVTLSRTTAYAQARSALKGRFGRAYRRGKRKRLSCGKQSSTRYRCTFSFRHRKKLRKGIVTVAIGPDGAVSTRIKRRDAHAGS